MGGQQGPIVQHRNCIQYPVVNHNGKDCEKNMKKQYIQLSHFAVHKKVT